MQGSARLYFVVVISSVLSDSSDPITDTLQGCFIGSEAIIWLSWCLEVTLKDWGKIGLYPSTITQAWVMYIIFGIYWKCRKSKVILISQLSLFCSVINRSLEGLPPCEQGCKGTTGKWAWQWTWFGVNRTNKRTNGLSPFFLWKGRGTMK